MINKNQSFFKKIMTVEWITFIFAIILSFRSAFGYFLLTAWWFYFLIHHRDFLCNIMGDVSMGGRRYSNAINYYKQSAKTTIAKMKYVKKYIIMELRYGEPEKAEKTIQFIEKIRKEKWLKENDLDLRYLKALIDWKKDDIDSSLNRLNEILAIQENEEIYGTLSYMHLIKGNNEETLEFSRQAYEKYPNNIIIKSIFTIAAYLNNNIELSSELFEELMYGNSNIPDTFYYYAKYMISKNEYKKAQLALKKGLLLEGKTIICSIKRDEFIDLLDMVKDKIEELEEVEDKEDIFDDFDNDFKDGKDTDFDEIAAGK